MSHMNNMTAREGITGKNRSGSKSILSEQRNHVLLPEVVFLTTIQGTLSVF